METKTNETRLHAIDMNKNERKYFRFRILQGDVTKEGRFKKTKSVGMAYLRTGESNYSMRLWTFVNERYYLSPHKEDPAKYYVVVREKNKNQNARFKTFFNIVGNAKVDSGLGLMKIEFDLFDKPVYMNIFPEPSAYAVTFPAPELDEETMEMSQVSSGVSQVSSGVSNEAA